MLLGVTRLGEKIKLVDLINELREKGKCIIGGELPAEADRVIELGIEGVDEITRILKHLAKPNKLKILLLLYKNSALPVCIISYALKLDQTLISHHLRSLEEAGLVTFERRGKFKFYKLTEVSQRLLDAILNVFKKE